MASRRLHGQLTRRSGREAAKRSSAANSTEVSDTMRQFWLWTTGWLMLAPAAVMAAPPETLLPPGELSTKGNQIVDRHGRPVRLACIGWNQIFETPSLERQTAL